MRTAVGAKEIPNLNNKNNRKTITTTRVIYQKVLARSLTRPFAGVFRVRVRACTSSDWKLWKGKINDRLFFVGCSWCCCFSFGFVTNSIGLGARAFVDRVRQCLSAYAWAVELLVSFFFNFCSCPRSFHQKYLIAACVLFRFSICATQISGIIFIDRCIIFRSILLCAYMHFLHTSIGTVQQQ